MPATPLTTRGRWARRAFTAAAVSGLVLGAAAGAAQAKEVGSGGTPAPAPSACNPVASIGYKGDATTSDTGAATVQVDYVVKPCVKGQVVTVDAQVYLTADPASVAYDDPAAPQSGRFTAGVTANKSYIAKITVTDAATGLVAGTKQIYVAAVYKGV